MSRSLESVAHHSNLGVVLLEQGSNSSAGIQRLANALRLAKSVSIACHCHTGGSVVSRGAFSLLAVPLPHEEAGAPKSCASQESLVMFQQGLLIRATGRRATGSHVSMDKSQDRRSSHSSSWEHSFQLCTTAIIWNLAVAYHRAGKLDKALKLYEKVEVGSLDLPYAARSWAYTLRIMAACNSAVAYHAMGDHCRALAACYRMGQILEFCRQPGQVISLEVNQEYILQLDRCVAVLQQLGLLLLEGGDPTAPAA